MKVLAAFISGSLLLSLGWIRFFSEATGIRRKVSDLLTAVEVAERVLLSQPKVLESVGSGWVSEGNRFWFDVSVNQVSGLI